MQTPSFSDHTHIIEGMFYHYAFIGNGAQFRVYAVYTHDGRATGRVVKIPLDFSETRQAIIEPLRKLDLHSSEDDLAESADKQTHHIMQFKHDMPRLIEGVLGKDMALQRKMGRLKMLQVPIPTSKKNDTTYRLPTLFTQEYVITLDEYLQQFRMATNPYMRSLDIHSAQQLSDVVDQIIALNFAIWEYGIFEFVFKPENFGIRFDKNDKPELLWIDLAEHITDQQKAIAILAESRWRHAVMPQKLDYQFMPAIIQQYYVDMCDKHLTAENLQKYWRRKSDQLEKTHARKLRMREIVTRDSKKAVSHWIARHNLSQSLYKGFSPAVIDDMEFPLGDIEKLLADREYLTAEKMTSVEEKVERAIAEFRDNDQHIFPIVRPPLSYERNHS